MTISIAPDRFVLDGSVTLSWLFQDAQDVYADAIIAKLPHVVMLVQTRDWHVATPAAIEWRPRQLQPRTPFDKPARSIPLASSAHRPACVLTALMMWHFRS